MITEADRLQAQFEVGDEVTFANGGMPRTHGKILKLNLRTATVLRGQERWRVPYRLLKAEGGVPLEHRLQRLVEVAREARELMDRHGLSEWDFQYIPARQRLGLCKEKEKVIQLGRHHAANDDPSQVTDSILHEIAHALAGAKAGHGPAWRDVAKRLGATPKALRPSDPGTDHRIRSAISVGKAASFRAAGDRILSGTIIRLNRKTARVSCGGRMMLVPYGCIVHPEGDESSILR